MRFTVTGVPAANGYYVSLANGSGEFFTNSGMKNLHWFITLSITVGN
jgi:hypothetical protein